MSSKKSADEPPYTLPETGFVRQSQLKKVIPFSAATLWRKVADKTFPQPVKLSAGVTAWRVEEVRAWIGVSHFAQPASLPAPAAAQPSSWGRDMARQESTAPSRRRPPATGTHVLGAAPSKSFERKLVAEAVAWRDADAIRAYIAHIVGTFVAIGDGPSLQRSDWLIDATLVADRLDPTQTRVAEVIVEIALQPHGGDSGDRVRTRCPVP